MEPGRKRRSFPVPPCRRQGTGRRLADDLHDPFELVAGGLMFQAGLESLPPFLGELTEQARAFGAALFVADLFRIDTLGEQPQHVDGDVRYFLELQTGRFGRTEAQPLHNPVALVAKRPAAAPCRGDSQIEVVAAGVFARPHGEVIFGGDRWFFQL